MTQSNAEDPLGLSDTLHEIREELECAVHSDAKVLISDEDGARREAIARWIHMRSARRAGPFVVVNCLTPDFHLDADLSEGTLFLDKVGQMSSRMQNELIALLENGADMRIIAATDEHLYEEMLAGEFREDLYYRLNVIYIVCPRPARAQTPDLPVKISQSAVASDPGTLGKAV